MSRNNHKVLIVIPDKPWLELLEDLVKQCGQTPVGCEDIRGALVALEKDKDFAVLVFDWELSKRKFPELINEVKKILPWMGRLVFIEQSDKEIRRLIEAKEFCSFVNKPFDIEEFEKALQRCIKKYEEKINEF